MTLDILAGDAEGFEFVNDAQGYSYLKINRDLSDFSFTSDFKSIGNSGRVGYFKYAEGLEGKALKDYIAAYDASEAKFGKSVDGGVVSLGDVKAGDRIGFYLLRNNDDLVKAWNFQFQNGAAYIAFDKNGGGKDEWMSIGGYSFGEAPVPAGAPLPGSMSILLVGGVVFGIARLRKRA